MLITKHQYSDFSSLDFVYMYISCESYDISARMESKFLIR